MKVSIIMATYNRAHFIVETLQAIHVQTYTNWECLIIDDGSTDNTYEVIKPFEETDSRFKYLKRSDNYKKGLPGSRNYGLDRAKGDYIIFFDDDDIVHPLCLEISASVLKLNADWFFCNFRKESFIDSFNDGLIDNNVDYKLIETDKTILQKVITNKIPFASCTVLWKKECFENIRFNENLMYAEEWECYSRILSKIKNGALIDKVLYYNRKHAESNTSEFWDNSSIRVNSKKMAIELVVGNLYKKNLLTPYLFKYLVNYAISFRDYNLIKDIFEITNTEIKLKLYYKLKYYLFPFWIFYMNKIKHKH
ncbi:glycosyltransferase family 2 protein [Mariniflexile sp.]|uniref:glycosyltransferase family 2 protein n=1 Tax=Mariniflexile sp. TaxID=1979402 RepID=UPI004048BBE7